MSLVEYSGEALAVALVFFRLRNFRSIVPPISRHSLRVSRCGRQMCRPSPETAICPGLDPEVVGSLADLRLISP